MQDSEYMVCFASCGVGFFQSKSETEVGSRCHFLIYWLYLMEQDAHNQSLMAK